MTSIPASRRARAITLAPRSWPSRPGLATSTRIFAWETICRLDYGISIVVAGRGGKHEGAEKARPELTRFISFMSLAAIFIANFAVAVSFERGSQGDFVKFAVPAENFRRITPARYQSHQLFCQIVI